ncbi:hypothetical protein ACQEUV_17320 [Micromonospora aurantiaca (nom. illeg.)]|uniref:hypothetical protein n=1 Tax=Micromonospora aurantiaca (nom. illeg.) TaxID=47850 RepID=UPI003DA54D6F
MPQWQRLYIVIEDVRYEVEPAAADTATSLLFRAWCGGCGTEFTFPFRLGARDLRAA